MQSEIEYTERHIVDVNENLQKYITACKEQLERIAHTKIIKYVYFRRGQEYTTNRVIYSVGVKCYPDIERPGVYEWTDPTYAKVFSGREKRQAQEYANQLVTQTGYELRGL